MRSQPLVVEKSTMPSTTSIGANTSGEPSGPKKGNLVTVRDGTLYVWGGKDFKNTFRRPRRSHPLGVNANAVDGTILLPATWAKLMQADKGL